MTLFKYQEDRWPVAIVYSGILLSFAPFVISGAAGWVLAAVGVLCRVLLPIHQHNHAHLSTYNYEAANAIHDAVLSVGGGNLTADWRVHHALGHHVDYLDPRKDFEGNLRFGEAVPFRRFVFALVGSSLSLIDSFIILKRFAPKLRRFHQTAILRQLVLQIGLFAILLSINWALTVGLFIVPNVLLRMGVFWFSYGQHEGLPMTNVYDSSTTKFNFGPKLLNVEFHTAHHERPGLHWSRLQARTEEILPLIHEKCVRR